MTQAAELRFDDIGTRSPLPYRAARHDGTTGEANAVLRAREMLRQNGELTVEQFQELDGIFRGLGQADFVALTEDPLHQAALRRYEALAWRQGSPAMIVVSLLSLIAISGATLLMLVG